MGTIPNNAGIAKDERNIVGISELGSEMDQIGDAAEDDREGNEPTLKEMTEMEAVNCLISKLGEN